MNGIKFKTSYLNLKHLKFYGKKDKDIVILGKEIKIFLLIAK